MYTIKNISSIRVDINNNYLYPGNTLDVESIDNLDRLIELGYIKVEVVLNKIYSEEQVLEVFFNYHLKTVTWDDIEILKDFYIHSKLAEGIDPDILSLLDESNSYEEFTEILLNSFYPALIRKEME